MWFENCIVQELVHVHLWIENWGTKDSKINLGLKVCINKRTKEVMRLKLWSVRWKSYRLICIGWSDLYLMLGNLIWSRIFIEFIFNSKVVNFWHRAFWRRWRYSIWRRVGGVVCRKNVGGKFSGEAFPRKLSAFHFVLSSALTLSAIVSTAHVSLMGHLCLLLLYVPKCNLNSQLCAFILIYHYNYVMFLIFMNTTYSSHYY